MKSVGFNEVRRTLGQIGQIRRKGRKGRKGRKSLISILVKSKILIFSKYLSKIPNFYFF